MKKLTNISPFLLLLVPVLVMMILTFASATNESNSDTALKSTSGTSVIKVSIPFIK